jgi:hypothetical protein
MCEKADVLLVTIVVDDIGFSIRKNLFGASNFIRAQVWP